MTTALVSLLTGIPVREDVAMTGEITLRGQVLPVGGIKEKALAAHRAGVKTFILPRRNEVDLDDLPADPAATTLRFVLAERSTRRWRWRCRMSSTLRRSQEAGRSSLRAVRRAHRSRARRRNRHPNRDDNAHDAGGPRGAVPLCSLV